MRRDDHELSIIKDHCIDSLIIETTIRFVAPFVLTYGFFMTFNGASTPGGAFQGGTIVAATILMIAFGLGIDDIRRKVKGSYLIDLMIAGSLIFSIIGLMGLAFGGSFFNHQFFTQLGIENGVKWSMEAVEVGGVFLIIVGSFVGLFFVIGSGFKPFRTGGEEL